MAMVSWKNRCLLFLAGRFIRKVYLQKRQRPALPGAASY
jgi:hypothetical protein